MRTFGRPKRYRICNTRYTGPLIVARAAFVRSIRRRRVLSARDRSRPRTIIVIINYY